MPRESLDIRCLDEDRVRGLLPQLLDRLDINTILCDNSEGTGGCFCVDGFYQDGRPCPECDGSGFILMIPDKLL